MSNVKQQNGGSVISVFSFIFYGN